jgi:hypothetical protein
MRCCGTGEEWNEWVDGSDGEDENVSTFQAMSAAIKEGCRVT